MMTYKQCRDYIRSDYYRCYGRRHESLPKMWVRSFLNPGFHFLFHLRLANCSHFLIRTPSRLIYRLIGIAQHIDIQRTTKIGYGFQLYHSGPVVVNASTVIGDNVDMFQNSTIGSSFTNAAHIGNDVYIGPSVCIVENVTIGDGVTIGAGAVVVKDIEAGATVAGVPAKVISHKEPGRLVYRKWDREWNEA